MAGATVIDQLIVKLGLDPRDFTKGQKQVAGEMIKTEGVVKKSSDSMGRSLLGLASKATLVAVAVVAVKKAVSYVSDLSVSVRQLGIDSRNFGIAANEMRNFQNIGEMMGGKAEDVTKTIGNLTKAVYDLAYNGQISDSLIMLGRLGVQFQDTAGNARDFKDIVLDTEKAIQNSMKHGTSYQSANQMLLQAGFDPGLARAMLQGNVSAQLAKQQGRRQTNAEAVSTSEARGQSEANRDQAIAAAALRVLPTEAKGETVINDKIAAAAEGLSNATLSGTLEEITKVTDAVGHAIENGAKKVVDSLENFGSKFSEGIDDMVRSLHHFPKGRVAYEATIQDAAKRNRLDPELLAGVLATESGFNPYAKSSKGAVGIAQLNPKHFPDAGNSPRHDIYQAAEYLRKLKDSYGSQGYTGGAQDEMMMRAYNWGPGNLAASMRPGGPVLPKETLDYTDKVRMYMDSAQASPGAHGAASGANNHTEVNIGKVDVITQATDADGIASDFTDATKRKMNAAQADRGMD